MITISVVMPTYNTPVNYLREAVESILNQTYTDFEFIIIDDASTDESVSYLNSLTDERIILIHNQTNLGVTKSLNIGFKKARGQYIARMDSDDISLPERLAKQRLFLEQHTEVIVCGTEYVQFSNLSKVKCKEFHQQINNQEMLRMGLLFENCGPAHPSTMFNATLIREHNIFYDESLVNAQDYEMWIRCVRIADIKIVPEILLIKRVHESQISTAGLTMQKSCAEIIRNREVNKVMGTENVDYRSLHEKYINAINPTTDGIKWLKILMKMNNQTLRYDKVRFKSFIYDKMINDAEKIFKIAKCQKNWISIIHLGYSLPLCCSIKFFSSRIKNKLTWQRNKSV